MILIVGSTGYLGSAVARTLAASGRPVVGLVRNVSSEKAQLLAAAGVTLIAGDLKDPASLARALAGVDSVICTASATLSRGDGDSIETVDRRGVQSLIATAGSAGVRNFIYVSFDHSRQTSPLAVAKREAEEKLKASPLNWTILQPSCFSEVWLSPALGFDVAGAKARIYGEGNQPLHYIALGDVAKAVVACVGNPAARRTTFRFGGGPVTPLEAVELFEKATGRTFTREHFPLAEIRAARAAATDPLTESFFSMFETFATTGDAVDLEWQEKLGIKPMELAEWVRQSVGR